MIQRSSRKPVSAWARHIQHADFALLFAVVVTAPLVLLCSGIVSAGEVVKFRMATEKTMHLQDEATAKSYGNSLNKLGSDYWIERHAGHVDLTVHCPTWRKAEFTDHSTATKWQEWLSALGFETRHQH